MKQLLRERFEILRTLGSGGMGVVYEAFDHAEGRLVALKALKKLSPQGLYLFKQEFRALSDLRHPNLIHLYELFSEGEFWFFTMELLSGKDFLAFVREEGVLATSDTLILGPEDARTELEPEIESKELSFVANINLARLRLALRQLIESLHALHQLGKVHRDIKPSNVMITQEGRLVLMDFGLVAESGAENSFVIGTPYFMAPEQAAGHPVTSAADWYSVGVMLFLALTGRLPFAGSSVQVLFEKQQREAPLPSSLLAEIPADLDAVCRALLRRRPEARPEVAQLLFMLGEDTSMEVSAVSLPFVGRSKELARLFEIFEQSKTLPQFAIIHGESGVGKSALVRHFLDQLLHRVGTFGVLILNGRCYEREQVPYKAFDGIIDLLSRWLLQRTPPHLQKLFPPQVALLGRLFPVLRQVPGIEAGAEPGDPRQVRRQAFRVLRQLIENIARRIQPVLWIDDIQWADGDSIALLEELLAPDGEAFPMMIVATQRANSSLRWVLRPVSIWIGSLSVSEAKQLLRSSFETELDPDELARLLEETRGHPLFLLELARSAKQIVPTRAASLKLDEVLQQRIRRQAPSARALVEVASIAGAPLSISVLARSLALLPGVVRAELFELQVGFLMRGSGDHLWEIYHDRVREAVLAYLSPEDARQYHLRLAESLEKETPNDPQALMLHFEAAAEPARAAHYALLAAKKAEETLAFERVAALLRVAIRLQAGPAREELYPQLGEALAQAGRGPEAADAFLDAAWFAGPERQLEYKSRAAEHLLGSGHLERARGVLSSVLSTIGEAWPESPTRLLASLFWSRALLKLPALLLAGPRVASTQELQRLDLYHALSLGLGPVDGLLAAYFQARGLLLALEVQEPLRLGRALVMEAIFLSTEGVHNQREVEALLDEAKRIADSSQDPYLACLLEMGIGIGHGTAGRFHEATQTLSMAEHHFLSLERPPAWELNNTRIFRFLSLRQMGLWEDIRYDLSIYLRDAESRRNLLARATLIRTIVQALLTQDDPQTASREIMQNHWPDSSLSYHAQKFNELLAKLDVVLYQNEALQAEHWLRPEFDKLWRSMLLRMQVMRVEALWARGRFALSLAQQATAKRDKARYLAEVEWLILQLSCEGYACAALWRQLLLAGLAVQRRQPDQATEHLIKARELGEARNMPLCAMVAYYRLGQFAPKSGAREEAAEWFKRQGIVAPARFVELFAPGF